MTLGELIAARRKLLFMTQEELAKHMNVSKSAVAKWETDGGLPDRDNLYRLSEIIGVSMEYIHRIINKIDINEENEVNITPDIIGVLESYGYKVIRPEEKDTKKI